MFGGTSKDNHVSRGDPPKVLNMIPVTGNPRTVSRRPLDVRLGPDPGLKDRLSEMRVMDPDHRHPRQGRKLARTLPPPFLDDEIGQYTG